MKGFFKNFKNTIKEKIKEDYEYFNGEGAVNRATKLYREIKLLIVKGWNKIIDKLINVQLMKMERELEKYYDLCKQYGVNPEEYYGERLKKRFYGR